MLGFSHGKEPAGPAWRKEGPLLKKQQALPKAAIGNPHALFFCF
jgi:hypothetical protein